MGTQPDTYILIGVDVGANWDNADDDDDWDAFHDRHKDIIIFKPEPGDYVTFGHEFSRYRYLGKVIDFNHGKWDYPSFNETFTIERLQKEIDEVAIVLKERWNIDAKPALHIISNI